MNFWENQLSVPYKMFLVLTVLILIGLLTGCATSKTQTIEYGDVYQVNTGFYKRCKGKVTDFKKSNNYELRLWCKNEDYLGYKWIPAQQLEKVNE